ncbi:hypothetical protein NQZ79_g989 [Umbelopsis isabellina]|nr:hypothetical protein NQZ79_g989 [Umbelopsis isabellina]
MPEDFVHPTIDFGDSTGSSRRNSQEIHDGPYYSTIDDLSSDGGYYSPAENSTTVIQLNQQVQIDQSRLLSSAASTATSTQEELSQNDQDKEGEVSGSVSDEEISKSQSDAESETQAQEETQETKETTASLSLSTSSLCDGMLWVREDLLVGGDNMFNVNICRLDDLRQAISRLQKETQILEETDLIIKRKLNHVASRRVRIRQDLVEDMDNWEFV